MQYFLQSRKTVVVHHHSSKIIISDVLSTSRKIVSGPTAFAEAYYAIADKFNNLIWSYVFGEMELLPTKGRLLL